MIAATETAAPVTTSKRDKIITDALAYARSLRRGDYQDAQNSAYSDALKAGWGETTAEDCALEAGSKF